MLVIYFLATFLLGMAIGVGICLWHDSGPTEIHEELIIREHTAEALEREKENE